MTVVLAWTGGETGVAAVRAAFEEACRRSSDLVVVSAEREQSAPSADVLAATVPDLARRLRDGGHDVRPGRATIADPSDAVIQVAQEAGAGLIVLGLGRRTPVGKMLLGSTAQRILLDSTVPVLAVHA